MPAQSRTVDESAAPESERFRTATTLTVASKRSVADGIVEFVLRAPDGSRLPDWAPGAHIDVILPNEVSEGGLVRQYSLCGDRWKPDEYTIMVRRETAGRGGSAALCDEVGVGDTLGFGGPRNNFRLAPAEEYLFIAGGIGITPILPMLDQAVRLGVPWKVLYLGRHREGLAGLEALKTAAGVGGGELTVHLSSEEGRADLGAFMPADRRVRVYACGPVSLLDAVESWGAPPGGRKPRVERFTAVASEGPAPSAFEVVAARSGVSATVAANESVVEALRRVGVGVLTSCAQGVCGTCETDVLEGSPDHRDSLLDDAERASGLCMFPCVSRSRDARLTLDV